jgi:hypothetical protein
MLRGIVAIGPSVNSFNRVPGIFGLTRVELHRQWMREGIEPPDTRIFSPGAKIN